MKRKFIILIFLIVPLFEMYSQDSIKPLFYFGPYADLNYNYHFTNFGDLPPFPNCCPQFRSGKGWGFSLGGFLEREIFEDINIFLRLGISDIGAKMKTNEYIGGTFVVTGNTPSTLIDTTAIVDYTINSKLMIFDIEPGIGMKFFNEFSFNLGAKFGYLFVSRFDQSEELKKPDNVTFLNGSRIRNNYVNELIPNSNSLQVFVTVALSYNLKIGNDLFLTPEIRYNVPFIDVSNSSTTEADYWKASSYQFGVSLKIPVYPAAPRVPVDTIFKQSIIRDTTIVAENNAVEHVKLVDTKTYNDGFKANETLYIDSTTIVEKYNKYVKKVIGLDVSVNSYSYDSSGAITKKPVITIEEIEEEEGFPLLTQIFFKEGGSDINSSGLRLLQKNQINSFSENDLQSKTLEIYSDLLNIVGSRMKNYPNTTITITGCNNNQTPSEINNQKLSIDRANTVKDYLISTWEIESPRIKIRRQNLPPSPGNGAVSDGIIENQRAEISSDDFEIVQPVFLKKISKTANPPEIIIKPVVKADAGLRNWDLSVTQDNKQLRNYTGEDLPDSIVWKVETEPMPSSEDDVAILLTANDNESQKKSAIDNLRISQKTIRKKRVELKDDKTIQKYSLILFDYDKSDLTPNHIKVLDLIKKEIKPGSRVEITGYADRTGEPEYNRELAKRRAEETQKQLLVAGADYKIIPVGSDELIYDNDNPQGRSYCRTVKIKIETPVK